jgi:hypothetical protein
MDPRKPVADEAIEDTDVERDESETADVHDVADTDGDLDDAGDGESDDGSEDLGEADDQADHDGSETDGAGPQGRQNVEGKPLSRGERRFQELSNRTRAAEQRAEEAERRAAAALAAAEERKTAAAREAEEERLRLMDPVERAEYRVQQAEQRFGQEIGRLQFQQQDATDQTKFSGLLARRPEFEKFSDDVERELAGLRRNGVNMPREAILYGIIGRNAVQKAPAAKTRAAKRGAENIQRQTARPSKGGGDVQRGNNRSGSESEKRRARLADQSI